MNVLNGNLPAYSFICEKERALVALAMKLAAHRPECLRDRQIARYSRVEFQQDALVA